MTTHDQFEEGQRIIDAANLEDMVYGGTPYELAARVIYQFRLQGFYLDTEFEEAPNAIEETIPPELAALFDQATKELI